MPDLLKRTSADLLRIGELGVDPTSGAVYRGATATAGGKALLESTKPIQIFAGLAQLTGTPTITDDSGHEPTGCTATITAQATDWLIAFPATTKVTYANVSIYRTNFETYGITPYIVSVGVGSMTIGIKQISTLGGRIWYTGSAWTYEGDILAATNPLVFDGGTKILAVNHYNSTDTVGIFYRNGAVGSVIYPPAMIVSNSADDIRPVYVKSATPSLGFSVKWVDPAGAAQAESTSMDISWSRTGFQRKIAPGAIAMTAFVTAWGTVS